MVWNYGRVYFYEFDIPVQIGRNIQFSHDLKSSFDHIPLTFVCCKHYGPSPLSPISTVTYLSLIFKEIFIVNLNALRYIVHKCNTTYMYFLVSEVWLVWAHSQNKYWNTVTC